MHKTTWQPYAHTHPSTSKQKYILIMIIMIDKKILYTIIIN